ncbi:hypothetical protein ACLH30_003475, partial [Edwardsiella piscicida]
PLSVLMLMPIACQNHRRRPCCGRRRPAQKTRRTLRYGDSEPTDVVSVIAVVSLDCRTNNKYR